LLTRVAFITENYCKLLYIESEKSLYPSPKFIIDTTNHITADIKGKIVETLKKMRDSFVEKTVDYTKSTFNKATEKMGDYARLAINPAAFVLSESIETDSDKADYIASGTTSLIKDGVTLAASPFAYLLLKSTNALRNDQKDTDITEPATSKEKPFIKVRLNQSKASTVNVLSKSSDVTKENKIADKGRYLASGTASLVKSGLKHTKSSLKYVFSKSSSALKKLWKDNEKLEK
jgi:hypothetical protein